MPETIADEALRPLAAPVIDALALALGTTRPQADAAARVAMAGFLEALARRLELPGGPEALADALAAIDPTGLDRLAGLIASGERQALVDGGMGLLTGLLGGPEAHRLTTAVAHETGLGQGRAQALLGMVTPAALAVLARCQAMRRLSHEALVAELVAGHGPDAAREPEGQPPPVPAGTATPGGRGLGRWLLGALVLLAAAVGGYWLLGEAMGR